MSFYWAVLNPRRFFYNNKLYLYGKRGLQRESQPEKRKAGRIGLEQDLADPSTSWSAGSSQQDQRSLEKKREESWLHPRNEHQLPGTQKEYQRFFQNAKRRQEKTVMIEWYIICTLSGMKGKGRIWVIRINKLKIFISVYPWSLFFWFNHAIRGRFRRTLPTFQVPPRLCTGSPSPASHHARKGRPSWTLLPLLQHQAQDTFHVMVGPLCDKRLQKVRRGCRLLFQTHKALHNCDALRSALLRGLPAVSELELLLTTRWLDPQETGLQ